MSPETGGLAVVRTLAEYEQLREQKAREREAARPAFSDILPTAPGCYVYRLWGLALSKSGCLYVGMVGENGPRRLSARLAEHKRTKPWWPAVQRIDAAECGMYDVGHEEALQIAALRPDHNRRTEGRKLTYREACEAQGWPALT